MITTWMEKKRKQKEKILQAENIRLLEQLSFFSSTLVPRQRSGNRLAPVMLPDASISNAAHERSETPLAAVPRCKRWRRSNRRECVQDATYVALNET